MATSLYYVLFCSCAPAPCSRAPTFKFTIIAQAVFLVDHAFPFACHKTKGLAAGLCQAALRVLKRREKSMHTDMLIVLVRFFMCLSDQTISAAMAALVPGGIVELAVAHIATAGQCEARTGVTLFMYFLRNIGSGERMGTPPVIDQLMKWFMKWFPEVRDMAVKQEASAMHALVKPSHNLHLPNFILRVSLSRVGD